MLTEYVDLKSETSVPMNTEWKIILDQNDSRSIILLYDANIHARKKIAFNVIIKMARYIVTRQGRAKSTY